ncbi:hypothetical protein ACF0H5_016129 [Mactra antiquata]
MGHNVSSSKQSSGVIQGNNVENSSNTITGNNNANHKVNGNIVDGFKQVSRRNVKIPDDKRMCDITSCHVLKDSSILVTDYSNRKLKKCNKNDSVLSIDLPCGPNDSCCLGNNNDVIVCGDNMLCYINTAGKMKITRTVSTDHKCNGITCHNDRVYIVDDTKLYEYSLTGVKGRTVYQNEPSSTKFCHVKVDTSGSVFYISDEMSGLYVVNTSGDLASTYFDQTLSEAQGVCVMDTGDVLVSGFQSDNVIEVDKTGTKKIRTLIQDAGYISDPKCLYFHEQTRDLYVGQWNDYLSIFKL